MYERYILSEDVKDIFIGKQEKKKKKLLRSKRHFAFQAYSVIKVSKDVFFMMPFC